MALRRALLLTALYVLPLCSAQYQQFYRWTAPKEQYKEGGLHRRQKLPPGYHPEFGTCGSGTTCENACGSTWESCKASTNLSLFCYNRVQLHQTCCENGSGRACDEGYYCAWNEFGGKVWCCKNDQTREECGAGPGPNPPDNSTTIKTVTTTIASPTYTTTTTEISGTNTVTTTTTTTAPGSTTTTTTTVTTPDGAVTVRVTDYVTTVITNEVTKTVTTTIYTGIVTTVTAFSTVTETITVCDSTPKPPHPNPTPKPGPHPVKPSDHDSSTPCPSSSPKYLVHATLGNITTTESLPAPVVTAGAGKLGAGGLAMVIAMVGMLFL